MYSSLHDSLFLFDVLEGELIRVCRFLAVSSLQTPVCSVVLRRSAPSSRLSTPEGPDAPLSFPGSALLTPEGPAASLCSLESALLTPEGPVTPISSPGSALLTPEGPVARS